MGRGDSAGFCDHEPPLFHLNFGGVPVEPDCTPMWGQCGQVP